MNRIQAGFAAAFVGVCSMVMGQAHDPADPSRDLSRIAAFTVQDLAIPQEPGDPFAFEVVLDGAAHRVEMVPSSVRGAGFRVVMIGADGVEREVQPPPTSTYRGVVQGVPGSGVGLSLTDGQIQGILLLPDADPEAGRVWWAIDPLTWYDPGAPRSAHVVYKASDLPSIPGFCGTVNLPVERLPGGEPGQGGLDNPLVCELAIDSDVQFYQLRGSNQATAIADIEAVINSVNVIYERDVNVRFDIVHTIIRTTAGPYTTTTNANTILEQFRNHWISAQGSVHRDLAHKFSGKDFSGSTIGIAYLSAVCSTNIGYGLVQAQGLSFAVRVAVSAHEIGHNFSAPHCDGDPTCRIMCSGLGGCSGIITSFGATEISQISAYAQTRSCLTPAVPPLINLPFRDEFPTVQIDPNHWEFINGVGINGTAINPPSPPLTLAFNNVSSITSKRMNLQPSMYAGGIFVAWWTQHRFVEAGKTMVAEYWSPFFNQWRELKTHVSNGENQTRFYWHEVRLPADAFGDTFRIRFTSNGNDGIDLWYVDDVSVTDLCFADINGDRSLDIFDFLDFSNLFAALDPLADWDQNGVHDIFDFLAYSNSFSAGCY